MAVNKKPEPPKYVHQEYPKYLYGPKKHAILVTTKEEHDGYAALGYAETPDDVVNSGADEPADTEVLGQEIDRLQQENDELKAQLAAAKKAPKKGDK